MSGRLVDGRRAGGAGGGALGGARKKKRLVIKPYKEKPKIPANFLEDTWTTLASAVAAVHRSALAGLQQESLYRAVEGLCGHRMGEQLYQRLEAACNAHIESMLGYR
jgi:cullin-4